MMAELSQTTDSAAGPPTLSEDERRKIGELFAACTIEGIRLGEVLLDSIGASPEDVAVVLGRTLLQRLAQSWNTGIWEQTYDVLKRYGCHHQFSALLLLSFVEQVSKRHTSDSEGVWRWMRTGYAHDVKNLLKRHDHCEWSGSIGFCQDELPWADVSFLTELDDELGDAIAMFRGAVHLDGLRDLKPKQAKILARHEGWLYLNGLTDVSDAVADALATHGSHLFLEGLTTLSHVGLAKKLAAKPVVYLDGLVSISPAAATALVQSGKQVFARSLKQPLPVVAGQ